METPSKINLFLQVTGKRPDSYHELDLLFYPLIKPADRVIVAFASNPSNCTAAGSVTLETDGPDLGDPDKNLCVRAVKQYFEHAGRQVPDCRIQLQKNIPVAAGMGGGSSDAAAVLLQLQEHYQLLDQDSMQQAALSLGADVPYFLKPDPARAKGVGEKLEILQGLPESLPVLLAAPGFPVLASWAYQHLDWEKVRQDTRTCEQMIDALRRRDLTAIAGLMRNDLAHALWQKFPVLNIIADAMRQTGALNVQITGSGPTLFGLYPDFERCAEAEKILQQQLDPSVRLIRPFDS